uniref:Uncharacterized protein n=1 Tax=Plectus sambesii TaxID=2011161 RepID=A0A914X091_9BILA
MELDVLLRGRRHRLKAFVAEDDVSSLPPSRDDSFHCRLQRTTSLHRCANRHHLPTQVKSLLPLQPWQNDSPLPPSRDDLSSSLPTLKDLLPSQPSRNDSLSLPPTLDYSLPPQPLRDASSPSLPSRGRLPPPTLNDRPLDCSTLLNCLLLRAWREPSMLKSEE